MYSKMYSDAIIGSTWIYQDVGGVRVVLVVTDKSTKHGTVSIKVIESVRSFIWPVGYVSNSFLLDGSHKFVPYQPCSVHIPINPENKMPIIYWKDVLQAHRLIGMMHDMMRYTEELGYKYFLWNDLVYKMPDGFDKYVQFTGQTKADLK